MEVRGSPVPAALALAVRVVAGWVPVPELLLPAVLVLLLAVLARLPAVLAVLVLAVLVRLLAGQALALPVLVGRVRVRRWSTCRWSPFDVGASCDWRS